MSGKLIKTSLIRELVSREFLDNISVNIGNISNYNLNDCNENLQINIK